MLRACHRVLRPGGVLAFAVIAAAEGLGDQEQAAAVAAGPPYVEAGPGYPALMAAAEFVGIGVTDVTADYLATAAAWLREWDAAAAELSPIVGTDTFRDQQADRRRAIAAIERGLLRRYLISSRRP